MFVAVKIVPLNLKIVCVLKKIVKDILLHIVKTLFLIDA